MTGHEHPDGTFALVTVSGTEFVCLRADGVWVRMLPASIPGAVIREGDITHVRTEIRGDEP